MMNRNPAQLGLIALGVMIATAVITYLIYGDFAVAIMMLIAAAGFQTIIAVMMIGSTHGESPVAASDSEAVARWNERVAKSAKPASPVTISEEASDSGDSD